MEKIRLHGTQMMWINDIINFLIKHTHPHCVSERDVLINVTEKLCENVTSDLVLPPSDFIDLTS